jgi:hypothetical protein
MKLRTVGYDKTQIVRDATANHGHHTVVVRSSQLARCEVVSGTGAEGGTPLIPHTNQQTNKPPGK